MALSDCLFEVPLRKFDTGPVTNNVLVGVDAYKFNDRRIQLRRNPSAAFPYAIDIYNPVYGGVSDVMTMSINTKEEQLSLIHI